MPRFDRHVFVCTNQRPPGDARGCCADRGSERVRQALKAKVKALGLEARVRANAAGCLDACEYGVAIVIYPDQVWYGGVKLEDVDEIVLTHLVGGEVVARLRIPDRCWGDCALAAPAGPFTD